MTLALVLGAGGPVGVTWEIGVLEALAARLDWDPRHAAVIVGTSAGARIGVHLRQGASPAELLADAQRTADEPPPPELAAAFADPAAGRLIAAHREEIGTGDPAASRRVAALSAQTPGLDGEIWVRINEHDLADRDWPAGTLCITGVSTATGARTVWTARSGVPLARAVASSMAVPGMVCPVEIGGDRYTDGGVWSASNVDVVLDHIAAEDVDSVLFVGPLLSPTSDVLDRELDVCAAAGLAVSRVVTGERFRTAGLEVLDPSARMPAMAIGREEGAAAAARVATEIGLGR